MYQYLRTETILHIDLPTYAPPETASFYYETWEHVTYVKGALFQ